MPQFGENNPNFRHGDRIVGLRCHEYSVWKAMRQRCNNSNHPRYKDYGERGVKVCRRWDVYSNFLDDMGRAPSSKHSLERIDNNKGYFPRNVRWATPAEQNRNSRQNVWITRNGKTLCVADWCKELGITSASVYSRARYKGINLEESIFWTPPKLESRPCVDCGKVFTPKKHKAARFCCPAHGTRWHHRQTYHARKEV